MATHLNTFYGFIMFKGRAKRFFVLSFIFCLLIYQTACSTSKGSHKKKAFHPAEIPLNIYQKFISPIDGARCRMYPSCSSYSKQAFVKHGFLKGWVMTCDRLLRCGRNELSVSPKIERSGRLYCSDTVDNNDFWWYQKPEHGDL